MTTSSSSSSFNLTFTWSLQRFTRSTNEVTSPIFTGHAPYNRLSWQLRVYPAGNHRQVSTRGFVTAHLELVTPPTLRSQVTDNGYSISGSPPGDKSISTSYRRPFKVSYKLGIMNVANKLVESCHEEEEFGPDKQRGRAKLFMRSRLLAEADSVLSGDNLTFRVELNYPEVLLLELAPTIDSADFGHLLDSQLFADIVIKCPQICLQADSSQRVKVHELPAHRAILAARSRVFEAMLTRDMTEKRTNEIVITDLEFAVVKEMLNYLYTGFVGNLAEYALDLLIAADKYDLASLSWLCERYLARHLTEVNFVEVMLVAYLLRLDHLKGACLDYVTRKQLLEHFKEKSHKFGPSFLGQTAYEAVIVDLKLLI